MRLKNYFLTFFVAIFFMLSMQSCGPQAHWFKEEPTVNKRDIELKLIHYKLNWGFTIWNCIGMPRFKKQIAGMKIAIQNNSQAAAKVIWNESSITYAGNSERVVFKHGSYKNAGGTFSPLVVPPQGQSTKTVYPESSLNYVTSSNSQEGSWEIEPMGLETGNRIKFSVRVEFDNGEKEYLNIDQEAPIPQSPIWLWNQGENCNTDQRK